MADKGKQTAPGKTGGSKSVDEKALKEKLGGKKPAGGGGGKK